MLDYGYHGYPGKSSGHKKLGSVWDYALDKTGECVQYACGLSWVKTESVGDILCDAAGGDDCNRVVGRAEVGQGYEAGNAEFRASLSVDALCKSVYYEVNASVDLYKFKHSSCHYRNDDQVCHSGNTTSYRSEEAAPCETACTEAYDGVHTESGSKDDSYIYT